MLFEEGVYPPKLILMERTSMTLADVDWLEENDYQRYREYYYFVVERINAEIRENQKLKDKADGLGAGGSGESDTYRFKDMPKDFFSELEEMDNK